MFTLISEVESAIQYVRPDNQDLLRSQITNAITNFVHAGTQLPSLSINLELVTRKFLKDNPNLVITRSDKGNVTVAMDRDAYLEKSLELLNDAETYRLVAKDPISSVENSCNNLIKTLKNKEFIPSEMAKALTTYNGTCPKFYGLPKVHKPDIPLRPIISCIGSSTQPLAKFISEILYRSFSNFNKFKIFDTFDFSQKINNVQLPEGFVLVSFDVVSLFTNIPLDLVVSIIEEHFELLEPNTKIPCNVFVSTINYLYNNTFFCFNGLFYKQVKGLPMGGATSPILAEIVMNKLLYFVTNNSQFQFPFIYQYVDDLLTAVPADRVGETLDLFNSFNENLRFTVEEETELSVPFLDTRVVRTGENRVILDWYRKKSSSGRYIPFSSYHPLKQKINAILALKNRIQKIVHPTLLEKNLRLLKDILINNQYPPNLINKLLFSNVTLNRLQPVNDVEGELPVPNKKYVKLQFIENLSPIISRLLSQHNIIVANYNQKKLSLFYTSLKDKTPTLQKLMLYMVSNVNVEKYTLVKLHKS